MLPGMLMHARRYFGPWLRYWGNTDGFVDSVCRLTGGPYSCATLAAHAFWVIAAWLEDCRWQRVTQSPAFRVSGYKIPNIAELRDADSPSKALLRKAICGTASLPSSFQACAVRTKGIIHRCETCCIYCAASVSQRF